MIAYNPERLGFLHIIFALRGTVIPSVLKSGMFWMTLVLHTLFYAIEFVMHYRFEGQPEDGRELWPGWENVPNAPLQSTIPGRDGLPRIPWEVRSRSVLPSPSTHCGRSPSAGGHGVADIVHLLPRLLHKFDAPALSGE